MVSDITLYSIHHAENGWWSFTSECWIPAWDPRCVTRIESYARTTAPKVGGDLEMFHSNNSVEALIQQLAELTSSRNRWYHEASNKEAEIARLRKGIEARDRALQKATRWGRLRSNSVFELQDAMRDHPLDVEVEVE